MGFVKKASALLDGVRRHRNDGRSSRRIKKPEVKSTVGKEEGKPAVSASELHRLRLRLGKAGAFVPSKEAETVALTAVASKLNHDKPSYRARPYSTMEVPRPIELVEDDEDDLEDEETYDGYEEDEDEGDEIDDSVAEDMRKLEESFRGISQKYRLINRIGEGNIAPVVRRCNSD